MPELNSYIKKSHLKAVERLNEDLKAFAWETGEAEATLYETPFTTFTLSGLKLENGYLCYIYDGQEDREQIVCQDEDTGEYYETLFHGIMDYIKFWRACLRRAKRYWSMDSEKLDRIQDGEEEDVDEEEED